MLEVLALVYSSLAHNRTGEITNDKLSMLADTPQSTNGRCNGGDG